MFDNMNEGQLRAELERLKAENVKLAQAALSKVTVKAGSDKDTGELTGTVCVYGINSIYPVSCYPDGWAKVFSVEEQVKALCNDPKVIAAAARSKARKQQEREEKKRNGAQG